MSDELVVLARFHARPGGAPALAEVLRAVSLATRAEPECLGHDVFRATGDDHLFYIQSRWATAAAFEVHVTRPHTLEFVAAVEPLIDHPLEVTRARRSP